MLPQSPLETTKSAARLRALLQACHPSILHNSIFCLLAKPLALSHEQTKACAQANNQAKINANSKAREYLDKKIKKIMSDQLKMRPPNKPITKP